MPGCTSRPIIWVLGGPASGKTTQCEKIVGLYGFTHLSVVDLIRNEIKKGSEEGCAIAAIMSNGDVVPTEIVLSLLTGAMDAVPSCCPGFLIDGYPHEKNQAAAFEKKIGPPKVVLYFEACDAVLTARLLTRAACSDRPDNNLEDIKSRLKHFRANYKKFLSKYKNQLVTINIDDGRTADAIFADVQTIFDNYVV